ncbi:MAG: aromatic ring-hydroxylating dioxygenase subunit alpha, partial [Acidimicrobiaceae bacterium]|nr:aromatic ring-hydroxylating dioxygenase subunit alpha [Acidimicrobiaceae bacterium]
MAPRVRTGAGPVVDNTSRALRRAWHAVATSSEVGTDPTQVWLLGQPWCLARIEDGRVAAWADRCPHRLAPLSAGRILDGQVECGYHGWRFGTDGRCTLIPARGQGPPPRRALVDVPWGIQERYGLVWLAPDVARSGLHSFPEWGSEGFATAMSEVIRTHAGAALLVDNFLDAAHFPFIHHRTFGVRDAAVVRDQGVRRVGWEVQTVFETWYREAGKTQRQLLTKVGNASLSVRLRLEFP